MKVGEKYIIKLPEMLLQFLKITIKVLLQRKYNSSVKTKQAL